MQNTVKYAFIVSLSLGLTACMSGPPDSKAEQCVGLKREMMINATQGREANEIVQDKQARLQQQYMALNCN